MQLTGLHHVTAVTANPQANAEFYTRALGLRLVKKTVNQDDTGAYHLFYGDELGHAGTEVTFFGWEFAGPNRPGPGTLGPIALRVSGQEALEWWAQHLDSLGVKHSDIDTRSGRA